MKEIGGARPHLFSSLAPRSCSRAEREKLTFLIPLFSHFLPFLIPFSFSLKTIIKTKIKLNSWVKYEQKEQENEDKGKLHPLHLFTKDAPPPGKLNPMRALIAPTTRKYIEGFKWVSGVEKEEGEKRIETRQQR